VTTANADGAVDLTVVRQVLQSRAGERLAISVIREDRAVSRPFTLPRDLEEALRYVQLQASTDQTVSVGVATLSREAAERLELAAGSGVRARPKHGEHDGYAWVAADLDPDDGEDRAVLHARLARFAHPPTLLASSGRGLHAWWRLVAAVDVETGRTVCEDLARALAGDPGAAHEGRALRLPGTFNGKPGVRRLAELLELEMDRSYPAEQLTAAACALVPRPATPPPRPRRVVELTVGSNVAEQLRAGHDLAEELSRLSGSPRRDGKWRCPAGHDETASLGLLHTDGQRWVCFGGSHPAGVGRATSNGQYSGDVVDLLALEADQSVEAFLSAERARQRPLAASPAARPAQHTSPAPATPAPATPPPAEERQARRGKEPAQADLLVELALADYVVGRSRTESHAVPRTGPRVALRLKGGGNSLRQHLAVAFSRRYGKTATAGALTDALNTLEGHALESDPVEVHLRLARQSSPAGAERVVADLGDATGRAVIVQGGSWSVVERSPVLHERSGLTMPLPEPGRGGQLEELRDLLNVTDETWPLLVGYLVAALIPDLPHPIALLSGEQGTGKSTAAKMLVDLLDPCAAALRSSPRDEETWGVSAAASYVVAIDNISTIPAWLSDAWCRAVTGDGMVRRRLYTDSDVSVLSLQRVLILTSIDAGAMRGDLAERLLTVELERIDPKQRRTERGLREAWLAAHPRLFGALLDLLAQVLVELPAARAELAEHPRMADFAEVLLAVDRVRGTHSLELYRRMGERLARDVAQSDPVSAAVLSLIATQGYGFRGPATQLLAELRKHYGGDQLPRDWPVDGARLTSRLRRLAPSLRASGVEVDTHRTKRTREVVLVKLEEMLSLEDAE